MVINMAVQNEFREKNEEKPVEKQAKKKVVAEPKQEAAPKTSLKNLGQRLDKKRTKTIIGVVLTLFSFFTFLSCFSFFFTWTADQDRILDKGLFEFLMEDNPEPVANWLGKFGAWMSHLFMYRWFGISSFAISFMIFLVGFKWMLNIRLFPLKRSFAVASLFMVWSSIFLGYFVQQIDYLGGTFGYTVNQWLTLSIGSFGSFIVVLALLYVVLVILFNADIRAWMDKFKARSQDMVEDEDEVPAGNAMTDIHVVNTIKENQIVQEEDPQEFSFEEEEDEEDEDDVDSFIVVQKGVEPIHSTLDGDYDPKLDLAGYVLPPIELLKEYGSGQVSINKQELEDNKNKIVETLSHYKIDIAKIKATVGPTVTLYEIVPAPGVRISKIKNLEDDIALSLSALGIRIIAPIPGKGTIGIEVPNSKPDMVSMRSLIASEKFQNSDFELPIVIGKTITNETFTFDLTKMPHLLVAGSTGQGKSVGLNAILVSMLYKKHPAQVKFVLVDPKKVE